jgi:hypothetical protein
MEPTENPMNDMYADITNEVEPENQEKTKKSAPKGFYSNYTHFVSIPLISEKLKTDLRAFNVNHIN